MITVAKILFSVTAPTAYRDGIFWYNPNDKALKVFQGGIWQDVTGSTASDLTGIKSRLDALEAKKSLSFSVVSELPTLSAANSDVIYFKTIPGATGANTHEEYVVVTVNGNKQWEKVGLADVDLSGCMKADGSNYSVENKTLVTPGITGTTWTAVKADGTTAISTTGWGNSVTLEPGAKITSCKAKFTNPTPSSTQASPERCAGDFGTTLPAVGGTSAEVTLMTNVTSNTTKTVTFYKKKAGLLVDNGKVVPASGEDSKSASINVSYSNRRYWGASASATLSSDGVKGLSGTELSNARAKSNVTYDCSGGKYFYYAYPASFGDAKVTVNGLSVSDCVVTTVNVVNTNGQTISYKVVRSANLQTGSAITVSFS